MNANARRARAAQRQLVREVRAARRAAKALATGAPQTAKTHLIAAGIPAALAGRYSGAFSRGVTPTAKITVTKKLKGRTAAQVEAKVYDLATFRARLATYRPRNAADAAAFAAVAA